MGITNTTVQIKTGFFHALGKVLSLDTNLIGNENYKSAHNVSTKEIWVDDIAFSEYYSDAINESTINDAVTMVGTPSTATLFPLANTNYQTWFFDEGTPSVLSNGFIPSSGWVKPIINPSDVANAAGAPSNGFGMRMFRNDGTTLISYDNVFYEVDYFSGLIKFQPGATPVDPAVSSGLGFQLDQAGFEAAASTSYAAAVAYLDTNGPKGVSFQYTGEFLDSYLNNLSPGGGGSGGSDEWQSSVNGYLTEIGNNETINGLTGINGQIDYMNTTYEKYFILTNDDISGVTWSGITATNSYYEFNGFTFSSYTLTDMDDENRFLLMENTLLLDTIVISPTGSVAEFPGTTVQANSIIEYTSGTASGLTYSAWQVTDPRLGMVTTLDNKSNSLTRYIGSTWVEYQYELTYKVNSQKDIEAYTTDTDYDIAINQTLEYEPSGDKSVDVLINGVEMPYSVYTWGNPTTEISMSVIASGTNTITVSNAEAPTIGQYVRLNNGTDYLRQVTNVVATGTSLVTYSGVSVPSVTTSWKFSITLRSSRVARKGDWLLWIGTGWYELTESVPKDLVTLEYVTMDDGAIYS